MGFLVREELGRKVVDWDFDSKKNCLYYSMIRDRIKHGLNEIISSYMVIFSKEPNKNCIILFG